MSCENTNARLQIKYTTIAGQVPTIPSTNDHNDGTWNPTDIYIGEFFLNSQDDLLWVRTLDGILAVGGTGGSASFIGDFVSKANGGTYSGPVFAPTFSAINMIATTISATAIDATIFGSTGSTYYGDGSNLTGITTNWNGGTVSDPTQFDNTVDFNQDISVSNVYPGTLGYIDIHSDIIVDGGLSASYFVGDGSLLTNLPIGPTANDYTTNAYLDGNIIRYDRTDLADAYSVDLTPILFTQSVASFDWNSSTNDATITINDGSFFTINLGIFNNISTAIINASDVYATNFYGTFNGTFSNDIYTTSASLVGTTAVFDRTDGITYSLDLSTLSGGGSGSVGPTGATGATGSQGYRAVMNLSYTGSGLTLGLGTITLPIGTPINNLGWQQGTRVRVWHSATQYMEGQITSVIANPQTTGINVNIDYVVGSGSFGQWYVGIAGDRGVSGATASGGGTQSLEQTLVIGNTTGTQSIYISSSASQIQGYNGINQHWYDAGAPFVGLGDYYQIENLAGLTQSYMRFYDKGDIMLENNQLYDTINSPANQDAKKTRAWLRPQAMRFNADRQDFDTNTLHIGSEMTITANAFVHESTDSINNCTAQIVASTDGTGTDTFVSLQAYHNGGASASKLAVRHDKIESRVDASVGTGNGPFTNIEQNYTTIAYNVVDSSNYSASGSVTRDYTSFGNDYISPNPPFADFHTRGSVNTLAGAGSGYETFGEVRFEDGTSFAYIRATDMGGAYPANKLVTGNSTDYTQIEQNLNYITVEASDTGFQGIKYDLDWSANYVNRSLVDKEYVDNAVAGGGGGATPSLSQVLVVGNTTGAKDIIFDNTYGLKNSTGEGSILLDQYEINATHKKYANATDWQRGLYQGGVGGSGGYAAITADDYNVTGNLYKASTVVTRADGNPGVNLAYQETNISTNTGMFTMIDVYRNSILINSASGSTLPNTLFTGMMYNFDHSANFTSRSLVDKAYVDSKVAGATGSQSLSSVLLVGATASTSINMNSNNITNISSLGNSGGTTIEMINIINMSLLALMYNT